MTSEPPLLEVNGLEKYFDQDTNLLDTLFGDSSDPVEAVDGVSLTLRQNESIGIIGESGCGKTTLLMTLLGLHEPTGGEILYRGRDLAEFDRSDWKAFRSDVQIVFQDPFNSLDPKLTVRDSLLEPLRVHNMGDKDRRVREALEQAELRPAENYLDRRPEQLSGGELQRVCIARALVLDPEIIFADEPVSMLDVSTQASILNLLAELIEDLDMSMFYISHDLSTVSYVCERINVMYLGRVVEAAPTLEFLEEPRHPYSRALVEAIPIPDPHADRGRTDIEGNPGNPVGLGSGCRFRDRCPERMEICEETPIDYPIDADTRVACHLYYDHEDHVGTGANDIAATESGSIRQ